MTRTIRRAALAALLLAPFATAAPALAQGPTAEGTVITNTATASWTDANGNSYTNATASVSVTVGFLAGPDVLSPPSVTPASPSTGNELGFTITNGGNGADSVSVAATANAGVTVTGYKLGSTTYGTLPELNAALAGTSISAGSSITVTVIYTVAPGQGGETIPVSVTATSRRTPGTSDASTTNVIPSVSAGVNVTPDGLTVQRLPNTATTPTYSQTFTVENSGNRSDTYTLLASTSTGAAVTIVSVNGTAGTGGSVTVASGGNTTVTVVYTVANVAAGTTDDLRLSATSGNNAGTSDQGNITVQVVKAAVSMTKEAFRDNQTTAIGASDRVIPGEYVQYRITVTNTGGAAASSVSVSDALPAQVTYDSATGDLAGWTISESSGTVTANLSGTLAASESRFIWIRVRIK